MDPSELSGPAVVILSEPDPVASQIAQRWGVHPTSGHAVDGAKLRERAPGVWYLRTPTLHIHDERLDRRLPPDLVAQHPTLIFPSIHRSEQNVRCLTVHPLGNPGSPAEVGGRPRTLVPTDPLRMTSALRLLDEGARGLGLRATFEATHHGPELALPAFFLEIGFGELEAPSAAEVAVIDRAVQELSPEGGDRIAVGVGGGHYAPHFTDLALRRAWAFGHLISRHALADLDRATAQASLATTPGADGFLFARAADADLAALRDVARRLRDGEAPLRPPERVTPARPKAD